MEGSPRGSRRAATAGVALLLLAGALADPHPLRAADPAAAAAQQLAATRGGTAADYELVYQRTTPSGGWAAKYLDQRTGDVVSMGRVAGGAIGAVAELREASAATVAGLPALERKAAPELLSAAAISGAREDLPVAVWLTADTNAAEQSVIDRHPDLTWIGNRPVVDDMAALRTVRAELWEARRQAYAASQDDLDETVTGMGGSIGYASTSAPLVFIDLPAGRLAELAALDGVVGMGLEGPTRPTLSSAAPAVGANWTSGTGDRGNGVRVGVVEYHNVRPGGDLNGQVVASYSTSGRLAYTSNGQLDHPSWVAGAVASIHGTYAGVAPGADIVTAGTGGYNPSLSTDRAIIAAADWAASPHGGDADMLNLSLGQDTAAGAEEARRYFDAVSAEDGRLVLAAAGNFTTFGHWDVLSPATGYNVLAVGGIDDRGTGGTGDDRIWFVPGSNGSNYRDRTGTAWNPTGDFNKPNVSAPAVSVRTANGMAASGTSVATPITAGVAAQLIARAPSLAAWPEATRAIITAGALRRTPMPNGSLNADHEGAGTVSAKWSNRILDRVTGYGGYALGVVEDGRTVTRQFSVYAGQRIRVALAWSSHTSGGNNLNKTDELRADLDLTVTVPGGGTVGSYSFDNAHEWLDVTAPQAGTVTVRIVSDRFEGDEEPYGLAWAISGPFRDADESAFRNDILWAWGEGVTKGCGPAVYCPSASVTREQMASFLVRALELPAGGRDRFTDDASSIHETDINTLARAGITDGCTATRFCPASPVTRAQMASFLVRALDLAPSTNNRFSDDNGNLHERDINALALAGITSGCAQGRYCPNDPVTRGEMAAFLHRAFGG
jgi:hypothetical protein